MAATHPSPPVGTPLRICLYCDFAVREGDHECPHGDHYGCCEAHDDLEAP